VLTFYFCSPIIRVTIFSPALFFSSGTAGAAAAVAGFEVARVTGGMEVGVATTTAAYGFAAATTTGAWVVLSGADGGAAAATGALAGTTAIEAGVASLIGATGAEV